MTRLKTIAFATALLTSVAAHAQQSSSRAGDADGAGPIAISSSPRAMRSRSTRARTAAPTSPISSLTMASSACRRSGVSRATGRIKGRAALIEAAGGDGKGGCKDPKTQMGYGISHIVANHVIMPSPEGATGKSYLLAIGVGGDPTTIERQGGYEDVYVKTPAGWRFKSRVHVFPNLSQSVQFGPRGRGARRPPPAPNTPPSRLADASPAMT